MALRSRFFIVGMLALAVVLAIAVPRQPVIASTPDLTVNASRVEVQRVTAPYDWVRATTVYEGSPSRLALDVSAAVSGSARITAILSGVALTVGDSTVAINTGSQTATIPLTLEYGAWLSSGLANTGTNLSINIAFTPTPIPSPDVVDVNTVTPTKPAVTPTEISPEATQIPATTTAPVTITFSGSGSSVGPSIREQLTQALAALPPGAVITVSLNPTLTKGKTSARDQRRATTRAKALAQELSKIAAANGQTLTPTIGKPIRVPKSVKAEGVRLRMSWTAPPQTPVTVVSLSARSGVQSTSLTVNFTLAPRPVIMLHGLWSAATTWSNYSQAGGFMKSANSTWEGYAVSTMNTGALLSPFGAVNTVDQNADAAWAYIVGVQALTNAHEVDIVAHSMGGIVTRRMLHDDDYETSARLAIRSVVMLGTPNGGSSCAETWAVKATVPLLTSEMETFNVANPGYPDTYSTLVYSDFLLFTCFDSSDGDSVVPDWSAQAQSVNYLYRMPSGVLHTSMTANSSMFTTYVKPALALASEPATPGLSPTRTNPNAPTTKLAEGVFATGAGATTSQNVTLASNQKLVVDVLSQTTSDTLSLTYTNATPALVTVVLTKQADLPVFSAEILPTDFGTGVARPVTLSGTTSDGAEWSFMITQR